MKNILIITYYWPPSGGPGVQRWVKFVKYLSRLGYNSFVLTVDPNFATYPQIDETLKNDIPDDAKVFYTKAWDPFTMYKKVSSNKEVPYGGFANTKKLDFKEKVLRFIRGNFFLPDPRRGWNKYAIEKAKEIIKAYSITTLITTSPPHSTQLIGLELKKQTDITWISDLRDPWTDLFYNNLLYQTRMAIAINKKLERKVLERADKVITVSEDVARLLCEKSQRVSEKIAIIPNGYDPDDFSSPRQIRKKDTFYISYVGTISNDYPIDGFCEAMKLLDEKIKSRIIIRFVGKLAPEHFGKLVKAGLKENIEEIGYVEHKLAIDYMHSSDILLLVIPNINNNKGILTGKIFEYLASNTPILLLGPENGDAAKIIEDSNAGFVSSYMNITRIKHIIMKLYSGDLNTIKKQQYANNSLIYSREKLTEKLIKNL